jgi:hypothetical protein
VLCCDLTCLLRPVPSDPLSCAMPVSRPSTPTNQQTHTSPDLKLLISSATLDAEKFSEYFDYAPIFKVIGSWVDYE